MSAYARHLAGALATLLLTAGGATAETRIASCYERVNLGGVEAPPLTGELYVLVDQTRPFQLDFQKHVNAKVQDYLTAGHRVTVISFSARAVSRYSEIRLQARMDIPLSEDARYTIPKRDLRQLDACLKRQSTTARSQTALALKRIFDSASGDLPKTELLANLGYLTERVIPRTRTADRVAVLLVSDMMENSEAVTFYRSGTLGTIEPIEALQQVREAGLSAQFDGLDVYVVGGLYGLAEDYLPATRVERLRRFWQSYVETSGGELVEFGAPYLSGRLTE